MNQTSPMNTATAAGAAAIVSPVVDYIAKQFHMTLTPEVLGSIVVLIVAGAHWISRLVDAKYGTKAAAPATQGGFARVGLLVMIAAGALGLSLLAGCGAPPTQTQVQQIQTACAVDKGVRPSVDILLAIPGLAKPEELAAVVAARAIVDPICANPAGVFSVDPTAQITQATATVVGLVAQLEARKAAK